MRTAFLQKMPLVQGLRPGAGPWEAQRIIAGIGLRQAIRGRPGLVLSGWLLGCLALGVAWVQTRLGAGEIPENPHRPQGGIEAAQWGLEPWGNSGTAEVVSQDKRKLLKLVFSGGEKEKAAYKLVTGSSADAAGSITLCVYSAEEKPPRVAVGISTTQAYLWHESKQHPLKQGWNRIEIPLASPHWKTERTQWTFKSGVEHPESIRAVDLLVFNGKAEGWLAVEGLCLPLDETARKVAALIEQLQAQDPEARAKAESELVAIGKPALAALERIRASERPEVILRATMALNKIREAEEKVPEDPELRKKVLGQREAALYEDALQRTQYMVKSLQLERKQLLKVLEDARADLRRGREEAGKLEHSSAEQKKALQEALDELERISGELLRAFDLQGQGKAAPAAAAAGPEGAADGKGAAEAERVRGAEEGKEAKDAAKRRKEQEKEQEKLKREEEEKRKKDEERRKKEEEKRRRQEAGE